MNIENIAHPEFGNHRHRALRGSPVQENDFLGMKANIDAAYSAKQEYNASSTSSSKEIAPFLYLL